MPIQTINLTAVDPIDFVNRMLVMGAKGAKLKDRTFPRLKGVPFAVQLEINTDIGIESAPGINPLPVPMSERLYTKDELEAMDWDLFKSAVQSKGIKGRQRDVMTVKYLQAVESGVSAVDSDDE